VLKTKKKMGYSTNENSNITYKGKSREKKCLTTFSMAIMLSF
jgi:hypothetical protein